MNRKFAAAVQFIACESKRKVRATQSTMLPNRKALGGNTGRQTVSQKGKPPRLVWVSVKKRCKRPLVSYVNSALRETSWVEKPNKPGAMAAR